jgi:phosphoglycerate dehydrogenase-like enzyme
MWNKQKVWNLEGKTLGIIGMGTIGTKVAHILLNGFGMKVLYFSRLLKQLGSKVDLKTLLESSDIVSIHASYSDETKNLIGQSELKLIKPGAVLVNASRAEIVDGHALYISLVSGELAMAAFDVYYKEPVPKPEEDVYKLLSLSDDKFIITPHTGYNTEDAIQKMNEMIIESLTSYLEGKEVKYRVF